jgi:peptide deformylase
MATKSIDGGNHLLSPLASEEIIGYHNSMALLEIIHFPDPLLKRRSIPVEEVTLEYRNLASDMLETMYDAPGIGLSAVQVGKLVRLVVMDTRPSGETEEEILEKMTELEQKITFPIVIFNPEVVEKRGQTTWEEGCLSVPGIYETVKRFDWVKVKGINPEGEEVVYEIDGLTSICFQHEIDHLDGKLFIDRLSMIKGNMIKNRIKKHGYPDLDDDEDDEEDLES